MDRGLVKFTLRDRHWFAEMVGEVWGDLEMIGVGELMANLSRFGCTHLLRWSAVVSGRQEDHPMSQQAIRLRRKEQLFRPPQTTSLSPQVTLCRASSVSAWLAHRPCSITERLQCAQVVDPATMRIRYPFAGKSTFSERLYQN